MVAAMHLAQQRALVGKQQHIAGKQVGPFKASRVAQRGMAVVRNATAAAAPPATGEIKDKNAELAINGAIRHAVDVARLLCHIAAILARMFHPTPWLMKAGSGAATVVRRSR
jgi:hypothetical protein